MENPYCNGIEGILEAYHQSLRTVQLYGPTNFAPVVNHVARWENTVCCCRLICAFIWNNKNIIHYHNKNEELLACANCLVEWLWNATVANGTFISNFYSLLFQGDKNLPKAEFPHHWEGFFFLKLDLN